LTAALPRSTTGAYSALPNSLAGSAAVSPLKGARGVKRKKGIERDGKRSG